jgi:hypothetical protein
MVSVASLWLPVVLAAVFVFIASSVIHMAPLWHRNDFQGMAHEAEVANALRPLNLAPGEYMLPWCAPKDRKSPEFAERMKQGPVAMLSILPNGPMSMARPLALWFVYLLIVGVFSALIAAHTLPAGTLYPRVFKVVLTASFMGYALALLQNSIWFRRPWSASFKGCFDALIYAALTAGTFGWLWPHTVP